MLGEIEQPESDRATRETELTTGKDPVEDYSTTRGEYAAGDDTKQTDQDLTNFWVSA